MVQLSNKREVIMFEGIFKKYITVKNVIFFVTLILFIIFVSKIKEVAIMFFASYVIACSLNPLVDKVQQKVKKRNIAASIVLFGSIAILIALITPIIILVGSELKNFSSSLPNYFNEVYKSIVGLPFIGKFGALELDWQGIISSASSYTTDIFNEIVNIGLNISSALIYLIVSVIIIYYFMADKELIKNTYLRLFPKNLRAKADNISDIISKKIGGYIFALIVTVSSVALVMVLGLSVFKVEYAVILGLITAILDIIPIVGPAIALVICLIATVESGTAAIIAVLGVFAVAQLVENNFVRPYVFGKFLDLHPIMIYLFLFITAKYMG
ncbi:AI-2E family transporter, partial [bacterium]|nr:AI-2E family transporter [bacterium]